MEAGDVLCLLFLFVLRGLGLFFTHRRTITTTTMMITASRISDGRASVRFRMKRWKLRPKLRQPSENASANFSPNVRCAVTVGV